MLVKCPHCGKSVLVYGLGRKRLDIPLNNICESLKAHGSTAVAARDLGCSPGYIFGALKTNGLMLKDIFADRPKHNKEKEE